jgi:hypothetical protein
MLMLFVVVAVFEVSHEANHQPYAVLVSKIQMNCIHNAPKLYPFLFGKSSQGLSSDELAHCIQIIAKPCIHILIGEVDSFLVLRKFP